MSDEKLKECPFCKIKPTHIKAFGYWIVDHSNECYMAKVLNYKPQENYHHINDDEFESWNRRSNAK